ncbi:peptidoglycan-binding domain-containing protein [Streptomyces sp. NPDC002144]|uniref:peptidoglycan-binding domain-containing protein n=1 Tax=Streptomyces sp. NPDC006668 TaxID=3156903 RepID=UPI0010DE7F3C
MRRALGAAAALLLPIALFAGPAAAAPLEKSPSAVTPVAAHTVPRPGTVLAQGPDDVCNDSISRPLLHLGSSGPAVAQLQCYLNNAIDAGIDEDGSFGRVTLSTVMDFQQCAGITVDGRVGAQTWSFLTLWANSPDAPFSC